MEESQLYARRHNIDLRNGFLIDGREIIPIYDPPHLLKGIRNNLLQKDVIFNIGATTQRASWKDVLAFY